MEAVTLLRKYENHLKFLDKLYDNEEEVMDMLMIRGQLVDIIDELTVSEFEQLVEYEKKLELFREKIIFKFPKLKNVFDRDQLEILRRFVLKVAI